MISDMILILSWILSALTLVVMWLAGSNNRRAWYLGIAIQPLWIVFAVVTHGYGLIALSLALALVYARNALIVRQHKPAPVDYSYSGDWLKDVPFGWDRTPPEYVNVTSHEPIGFER